MLRLTYKAQLSMCARLPRQEVLFFLLCKMLMPYLISDSHGFNVPKKIRDVVRRHIQWSNSKFAIPFAFITQQK
jgi:hypothetical protein